MSGGQVPGWYYAQGDPPGTVRYWDGEIWQGEPVASPAGGPAMGPTAYRTFPEASQATTGLVLGILSFLVCQLIGPFAWNISQKEIDAIDRGRRDPNNRGTAVAGKVLGIISTILLVVVIVVIIVAVIAGVSSSSSDF